MISNDNKTHCGLHPQHLVASILPPVLIIEVMLGLPGNLMALWVFCRHFQSWKTNIVFLLNLVLADFLLLVSLPFRIDALLREENWVFGSTWCCINLFMLAVNRSASIGFMTTVAVDRYFKVVHPHHKVNFINMWQAAGITWFIWTVVILLRIPLLTNDLLFKHNNTSVCRSFNPDEQPSLGLWLHYAVYLSEFFICLMILLFCAIRISCFLRHRQMDKKKKSRQAVKIIWVIIGVFFICFFPGVATGLYLLYLKTLGDNYCIHFEFIGQLFVMSIGFTYLNSTLDPLIYVFCSSLFRNAVKLTIKQMIGLKPSHNERALS